MSDKKVVPMNKNLKQLKSINITQVSNGFIAEAARSSSEEDDAQVRASVHPTLDELLTYLDEFFVE